MNVTIIMPLYNPNKEILKKIEKTILEQDFEGKISLKKIDKGLGLADSLNYGIKKSKTEIVVSLHQDCVPTSKDWLKRLVKPLEREKIVASVSDVELPLKFWKSFSFFARIMSVKEQGMLRPLMDEKGVAYKKSILKKVGFFDGKNFRTAGEDFDMYLKLKKEGEIAYSGAKVLHFHEHNFRNRIKKEYQLSNGFGALVRIYGKEMPSWFVGLLKAIPVLGWPIFLIKFPYLKMPLGGFVWIVLSMIVHVIYVFGFWKGFLKGRQTV
jgi:GT2 family glycosyltransferase